MRSYKVKQLAQLAGVSVRTLHHYDQIGLLSPSYVGENGYRFYERAELMRLQEILFFKEMGLSLSEIATALEKSDLERAELLKTHRAEMERQAKRQRQLIETIDKTIAELTGAKKMDVKDLYKGFSEETQREYQQWLIDKYGADMPQRIEEMRQKLEDDMSGGKDQIVAQRMAELADIEGAIVRAMQDGIAPEAPQLDDDLARHNSWVGQWWGKTPDQASYIGLADMYQSHPDFVARYEALAPGFSDFLTTAMKSFAARKLS